MFMDKYRMLDLQVAATVHSGDLGPSAIDHVSWEKWTCPEVVMTYFTVIGEAIVCCIVEVRVGSSQV
jgi:hypothetical protein